MPKFRKTVLIPKNILMILVPIQQVITTISPSSIAMVAVLVTLVRVRLVVTLASKMVL